MSVMTPGVTGDYVTEGYAALHSGAAWMDLSSRGKIRVTGEDRARLLHAMTTNHIQALKAGAGGGDGCYVFFLNAQGKILGDANVFCLEDSMLLDTEPETRTKLYDHLDRYIIADDVALEDETEKLATIAVEGPEAARVLASLGAPLPDAPGSWIAWGQTIVARVDSTGSGGFFLFLPVAAKSSLVAQLESACLPLATPEDARTARIENQKPRYGEEITERYLIQETGQLQAVSFNKGCYLGQEVVERVRSRAHIHRMLKALEIEATEAPPAGAKLKSGEADAGEIVSAAVSPRLGKVAAMAYVRVPFTEPGTELTLDGAPARVVD